MSSRETSPLPWTAGNYGAEGWYEDEGWIEDAKGLTVALYREVGPGYEDRLCAVDARLIVRCVNSHDALIEALREALDLFGHEWTHADGTIVGKSGSRSAGAAWVQRARDALAAATGQADADPVEQR